MSDKRLLEVLDHLRDALGKFSEDINRFVEQINTLSGYDVNEDAENAQLDPDTISRKQAIDALESDYAYAAAKIIKALPPSPQITDTDTVSRQAVRDAVYEELDSIDHVPQWVFDRLTKKIENLPPSPSRPQGYWKGKPIAGFTTVRCSCCGTAFCENEGLWKYCPECGADMGQNGGAV